MSPTARQLAMTASEEAAQETVAREARESDARDEQVQLMVARSKLPDWLPDVDWVVVDATPPTLAVVAPPEEDFHVQLRAGSREPELRLVQCVNRDDGSSYWTGPVVSSLAELGAYLT